MGNWTLDNTFLESFTSSASPEDECPRLFCTSGQKRCFDPILMHFCSLTVSVFITLKFTFIDYDLSKTNKLICGYWIKYCMAVHLTSNTYSH